MWASTSLNPVCFHSLLQGWLYLFNCLFIFSSFNNAVRLYKPWKTALRCPLWTVRGGNSDRVHAVPGNRSYAYVWCLIHASVMPIESSSGSLVICYISFHLYRHSSSSLLFTLPHFSLIFFRNMPCYTTNFYSPYFLHGLKYSKLCVRSLLHFLFMALEQST
jgi:hypothetical protein